jgi:hypothetical protein
VIALEVIHWRGVLMDNLTAQAWEEAEGYLGHTVTRTQGCYTDRVAASAGYHSKGGVADGPGHMDAKTMRAFMRAGWCPFAREELWRHGVRVWPAHTHMVLHSHPRVAVGAELQKLSYVHDWDGLGYINPNTGESDAQWSGPCERLLPPPNFYEEDYMDYDRLQRIVASASTAAVKASIDDIARAVRDQPINVHDDAPGSEIEFRGASCGDTWKAPARDHMPTP